MKFKPALLATAFAALIATPTSAGVGSFTLEGLALTRDDYGSELLVTDATPTTTQFFASDVDVEWTGGARATYENDFWGHSWQLRGFFIAPQENSVSVPDRSGAGSLTAGFVGGAGLNPVNATNALGSNFRAEWELWGGEFDWVKNLAGWGWKNVDFIFGLRYINFNEDLDSQFDKTSRTFAGGLANQSFANIGVENNLVGLQIGLQGDWNIANNVMVGGELKGGLAANFATRDRRFAAVANAVNFSDSIDDTNLSEFVEFNPRVTFALNDNAKIVVGGSVLWMNDVSTAASHYKTVDVAADSDIRNDDDVLVYGASVGLKIALN